MNKYKTRLTKYNMKNLIKKLKETYIKARIKCVLYSVRRSYFRELQNDIIIYGACYEEKVNYNWLEKIIRRIKRLPTDRRRIKPTEVRI